LHTHLTINISLQLNNSLQKYKTSLEPFFWNGRGRPGLVLSRDRSFWPNRSGPRKKNG